MSSTRITTPFDHLPFNKKAVTQTHISQELFDSLQKKIICGTKGTLSAIIAVCLSKLHDEYIARGWPLQYEPENESRLQQLLDELNFGPRPKPPIKRKSSPPISTTP